MDKLCSTLCVLIFAFGALVHFDTVFAVEAEGNLTVKPGFCPRRRRDVGICVELCSKDSDCPKNKKCCSNGCGHVCKAPYKVKPGFCPRRRWGAGICAELCSNDSNCPKNKKCCSNGCGHVCMTPYKGETLSWKNLHGVSNMRHRGHNRSSTGSNLVLKV